ncbi:TenA family protein KNAG_0C04770 [Huiozyma naganishii CBS 8797]|uniref:Thiaminase-2/PQQC domain-containing protein n=1 Tax=Huiozyma naganishii (strain ATCC MYA-139 / BCRC 22969 / CBS 8797 / KCTC 17520 / NBRC 10181 / NCYC 3082 / Yp74L-3) TaxID=1071383 RepID=J7RJ81_HUIN7|nr:hypothetical protein KNAG_0C04770 [Kazachstania naganishii CBS 8797]CCK69578.1 hypothetical protein KNAG_0C04770 [Kazachstania naganishii CBS 8797]
MSSTTDILKQRHPEIYKKATEHQLTKELCQGTLSDRNLFVYLAQDVQFFETGLRLICKITSGAPAVDSLITLAKKIGFFASDENTYFRDALELLSSSVTPAEKTKFETERLDRIAPYVDFLTEMLESSTMSYAEYVTYLWVAEDVYLKWAHDLPKKEGLHWKYQTWIDLHDGQHFIEWVDFLRDEIDKFPVDVVEKMFVKCVNFEFDFFDGCYNA